MNQSHNTELSCPQKQHRFDDPPCWNPFGPVVGNMQHVISCDYRNHRGEIYVASKALCFRRTAALFGWEIFQMVVPWESIKAIDIVSGRSSSIFIQTKNDEQHEIRGFGDDVKDIWKLLSDAWNRWDVKTEQDAENDRVVNQLVKRLSLFSEKEKESDECCKGKSTDSGILDGVKGHHQHSMSKEQLQNLWSTICSEKDSRLSEKVTVNLELNVTVDEFFDMFLSDDAALSLASHHEATGDENVTCTKWQQQPSNMFTMKRLITYSHPIDIPLAIAPPAGSATKTQIMKRCQEGICIDTETWISNVPLADCFYVADRLLVCTNPSSGGVFLTVMFGNCFVKPTLFQRIIASTSTRDVTMFHKAYIEKIQNHAIIHGRKNTLETSPSQENVLIPLPIPAVKNSLHHQPTTFQWYLVIMLLFFVSFYNQIILMKELQKMSEIITTLEAAIIQQQQQQQ